MFEATRPFKNTVTGYDKEPSLRIGKKVPKDAVNLAYYYNPTSTKSERILASDPPRLTIDHRVETQWLTKVDQASGPNGEEPSIDLFPKSIYYSDEEGYYGRLARQDETVKWYPEYHVNQKEITKDSIQIVDKKGDEDKVIEYSDANGYKGNLYLDTVTYEAYTTKDVSVIQDLDYTINDFELNYFEIFGKYLSAEDINNGPWTNVPNAIVGEDYCWPAQIQITPTNLIATDTGNVTTNTNNTIANFVNKLTNDWEGTNEQFINDPNIYSSSKPVGTIYFDKLEYEPVKYNTDPKDGNISKERKITGIKTDNFNWQVTADMEDYTNKIPGWEKVKLNGAEPKKTYLSEMGVNYDEIEDFMVFIASVPGSQVVIGLLQKAIDDGKDIAIWLSDLKFVVNDESIDMLVDGVNVPGTEENEINASADPSPCHFELGYKYVISDKGSEGTILYNVTANYHTITLSDGTCSVKRTVATKKEEAASYRAHCHYSGLADKNWVDYDGIAFYMGAVTKGNSAGNQNGDNEAEMLMFPDEYGYLRQIIEGLETSTDENNQPVYETVYKDYYTVEADTVYVTDVFKDNQACFYRYRLKQPIYDYRGPDKDGFYKGDAVQIYTNTLKNVPSNYKHSIKLVPARYEDIETYDQFNNKIINTVPKCYFAELYTSFLSSSTDTFKAVYNGFNDIDNDNKVLNNGIQEDIYNYPSMIEGVDYEVKKFNRKTRLNYIQILNYTPIVDDRRRITFTWKVVAFNKEKNITFETQVRQSSILNKDYCIPYEYSQFQGRGMIISPKLEGDSVHCSPRDLCLHDQAGYQSLDNDYEPLISDTDYSLTYTVQIVDIANAGSVNIKCNPDGSGYITAETTLDTGFFNDVTGSYTTKLDLENPYFADGKYIYKGYKVRCIDNRTIKVKAPREEKLLQSWYPMIQFGHYSRIMDQYGAHTKVCYSMPEYDEQHYSEIYGQPYMDVKEEKVTILNPHMVQTLCYPLHLINPSLDENTYIFKDKYYKIFEETVTWKEAENKCKHAGGHLAMPKTQEEFDFFAELVKHHEHFGLWIGAYKKNNQWVWADDSVVTQTNFYGTPNAETDANYVMMYGSDNASSDYYGKWVNRKNNYDKVNGYICELTGTIEIFKRVDDELFKLTPEYVSFSDGVIVLKETISENDDIIANYTYLEENYNYRGYWRTQDDFVRIDLNPNIYHTYNNPNFLPSEISPSKNLFNKVIYFFLKPTGQYEISSDQDSLYYSTDRFKKVEKTRTVRKKQVITKEIPYQETQIEYSNSMPLQDLTLVNSEYSPTEKQIASFVYDGTKPYTGSFSLTMATGHWNYFKIEVYDDVSNKWTLLVNKASGAPHNMQPWTATVDNVTFLPTYRYRILTKECDVGGTDASNFVYNFGVDEDIMIKLVTKEETITKYKTEVKTVYGDVQEKYYTLEPNELIQNVISENEDCLYHKIDDPEPDADEDLLLGSVYIRQNTSLHSTIVTDSRTRGGGILEEISDKLRHELEPESDFYLDIGYYDGQPYQENGTIIVRLDNKILKEYGGRFTIGDVETKVKRWLGAGIYPIIEFVDTYSKKDLPQYNLEIEDSYTNVIDVIPEFTVECIEI